MHQHVTNDRPNNSHALTFLKELYCLILRFMEILTFSLMGERWTSALLSSCAFLLSQFVGGKILKGFYYTETGFN